MTYILFICAGNICRSPMAEAIFAHLAAQAGRAHEFHIESAGTGGWHTGEKPDVRTIRVLEERGIAWRSTARQISRHDFERFHHLVAMDSANLDDLLNVGAPPERVSLMLSWNPSSPVTEVPDPYYGSLADFESVFDLLEPACRELLARIGTSTA
jgi:protein-tyrosine phosphatase